VKKMLAAFLLFAAMGCGRKEQAEEKPEPTEVQTAIVEESAITEWVELQGRVAPPFDRDATLAPQVSGRIVFLAARVGAAVPEGQVLARVETGALEDELKAAEASARRAEADAAFKRGVAKRSLDLVTKGVASREEAETADDAAVAAEAARIEAAAALATARRRFAWSEVKAPFAGVVVRVDRRIGDFVDGTQATPVLEIATAEGWEITASAAAAALQRLRAGQTSLIKGLSPGAEIAASVVTLARAVDPATGAGDVRLVPRIRPEGVALGTPVEVRVAVTAHTKAVVVPRAALRMAPDGTAEVVVVENDKAHIRKVQVGLSESDRVEVISGVTVGAHVVIEDPIGIAEGAAIAEKSGEEEDDDEKDEKGDKDKNAKGDKDPKAPETPAKTPKSEKK
jgi:RND family efflux transporter MFP subunit